MASSDMGIPEPGAEFPEFRLVELFLLVGDVFAFPGLPQAVALDGAGQDHRGGAPMPDGRMIGRIHLFRVMAADAKAPELIVGKVGHPFEQFGVFAEKVASQIGAAPDDIVLPFPVHVFVHAPGQQAVRVSGQQFVPFAAPDHLDDIPAGAAENGFQFLDDTAVAPDRAVQPLQVAVDHEDQVVQPFPGRQGDGAQRFRLVRFAVAHETPDLGVRRRLEAPIFQVPVEPGLVDGHDGPQPHGHRGKLPEIRAQPRVRIRRQAPARMAFVPEIFQVLDGEPSFEKGPGVVAGGRVALEVDLVAAALGIRAAEEMMEADFIQGGNGCKGGDVAADARFHPVGPDHHGHGIPADDALDAPFDFPAARVDRLPVRRDGVDVGGVGGKGQVNAQGQCPMLERFEQPDHPAGIVLADHVVQRFHPFGKLDIFDGCRRAGVIGGAHGASPFHAGYKTYGWGWIDRSRFKPANRMNRESILFCFCLGVLPVTVWRKIG